MKKYFVHNGQQQEGPFEKEELRAKVVKSTTLVWFEGAEDWIEAGKVDDLKDMFVEPPPLRTNTTPPPLRATAATTPPSPPTSSKLNGWQWLGIGLGVVGICYLGLAFLSGGFSSGGGYNEKVMTVEEIERQDPVRFLSVEGTYRTNFWGDQMVIEGVVNNNATVANYKDVVIQVYLLSETDTRIDSKNYVVYKQFPAHGRTEFKLRVERPTAAKKVDLNVVGATPVL